MSYKVTDVFVAGGLPQYTYVARKGIDLEKRIAQAKNNLCKIITVTGSTKSGKTVLARKVFPSSECVWIDGGLVSDIDEFWDLVASQLEVVLEESVSKTKISSSEDGFEIQAEANALIVKGGGKYSKKGVHGKANTVVQRTSFSRRSQSMGLLKANHTPVIIDDFHYIDRDLQGKITRILKPLVFEGVPVLFLAIPHRRFDAIKVEREMNGRVENVLVPIWDLDELSQIAQLGFPLLNVNPDEAVSLKLAAEAQGSPHLMQEFCKKICLLSGIEETATKQMRIVAHFPYENIFYNVALDLGRNIFERLARGPRTRADRKQRLLKNGNKADIYKVVLIGLAELKPGVSTIEYEPLRSSIKAILDDVLPQAHEVSRVLEQMAKISSTDESSVPVIDYEKEDRKLHVTDPFFAFFLRWGRNLISS